MSAIRFLSVVSIVSLGLVLAIAQSGSKPSEQFVIVVYETPEEYALRTDMTEKGQAYWGPWMAYRESLEKAGVLRGGLPLQLEESVRQVRVKDGKVDVKNGPITASKPQWTGFFLIEVENRDKAIEWAAKVPNADHHTVEVRPGFPVKK